MACHYIFLKDEISFVEKMANKEPELIVKIVKCVLSAIKRKRKSIDIFEITFKDTTQMTFTITKDNYKECLLTYLDVLIEMDEQDMYLLCAEIQKVTSPQKRVTYKTEPNETEAV